MASALASQSLEFGNKTATASPVFAPQPRSAWDRRSTRSRSSPNVLQPPLDSVIAMRLGCRSAICQKPNAPSQR